jgi:hypothetical protein
MELLEFLSEVLPMPKGNIDVLVTQIQNELAPYIDSLNSVPKLAPYIDSFSVPKLANYCLQCLSNNFSDFGTVQTVNTLNVAPPRVLFHLNTAGSPIFNGYPLIRLPVQDAPVCLDLLKSLPNPHY